MKVHDPSHVDPRAEKIKAQAKAFGGAAVEGLTAVSEKHLFIDLPAGSADAFRRAALENTPVDALHRGRRPDLRRRMPLATRWKCSFARRPAMNSRMPRPVVVTFAVPDESRGFIPVTERGPVIVVHIHGVGDTPAGRRRLNTVIEQDEPRLIVSAGYAGALRSDLRVGDLVLGENFTAADLLAPSRAALASEPLHIGKLTTQLVLAETASAKSALHAATGARSRSTWKRHGSPKIARARECRCCRLRVISDAAGETFPVPNAVLFDLARQTPRYVALPAWLLLPSVAHPAVRSALCATWVPPARGS